MRRRGERFENDRQTSVLLLWSMHLRIQHPFPRSNAKSKLKLKMLQAMSLLVEVLIRSSLSSNRQSLKMKPMPMKFNQNQSPFDCRKSTTHQPSTGHGRTKTERQRPTHFIDEVMPTVNTKGLRNEQAVQDLLDNFVNHDY